MGNKERNGKLEKVFDILGEILAVLLIVTFILLLINAQFPFIGVETTFYAVLKGFLFYGCFALVLVVGAEAISKRNILFKIIFLLCAVIMIIFVCFPSTYTQLVGLIP